MVTTINPANDQELETYKDMSVNDACDTINLSHRAFEDWRLKSFDYRAEKMRALANLLKDRVNDLAPMMTQEMGKPITQAKAEIEKCAWVCEYYADNAAEFLKDEEVKTDFDRSFITYQPIGVVLAIMPWNFPFWQVIRFAAPTLMAGNAAVLKHASSVTGCSLAIEQLFKDAGFPQNLFRSLVINSNDMKDIIPDHNIRAVTLTGSTVAGQKVAEIAGRHLKKTVLELGGSDAYLILDDADIEMAAKHCAASRLQNTGQSCIAAKRFIVQESVHDDFVAALKAEMESKTMGDPMNDKTDIGALASVAARDELHDQVTASIAKGATCVLGGEVPEKDGAWYPPTILSDVTEGMPAFHEEMFGPVAAVIEVKDPSDAIRLANNSNFGLGGGVFSTDIDKATAIARDKMDTGTVAVNGFVKSNPHLPFGGVKDSGYGRELSRFGIHEFVNIKTVTVGG
jgi:succinate-semialdehyde dehydrogenase/glutarate-semialdehyde dehydrogenase